MISIILETLSFGVEKCFKILINRLNLSLIFFSSLAIDCTICNERESEYYFPAYYTVLSAFVLYNCSHMLVLTARLLL